MWGVWCERLDYRTALFRAFERRLAKPQEGGAMKTTSSKPTGKLRYVVNQGYTTVGRGYTAPKLQQQWMISEREGDEGGRSNFEWRDVPIEVEI